jgi:hypothetical protein
MKNAVKKMAEGGEALSPEELKTRARLRQEAQDAKDAKKQEKAYEDSLTSPEMVMPKKAPKTPPVKKAMGGMMNKGYSEGGMIKKRGMGAATRGGKCKMS